MSIIVDINDFSNGSIDSSNPQDPKWDGTGVFDIIMKAANENIKIQSQTSRITGAEYAEVYLGTMQSAIAEAMKFLLAKEITEKDIELKDSQIVGMGYDNQVKAEQVIMSVFEREFIQPKQLEKVTAEISLMGKDEELKDSQIVGSGYDNQVKEQQVAESKFKVTNMLPAEEARLIAQTNEIKDATIRSNTKLDDELLTTEKQRAVLDEELETSDKQQELLDKQIKIAYVERVIKDKEAAALGMDNVVKVANTPATTEDVYTPKYEE